MSHSNLRVRDNMVIIQAGPPSRAIAGPSLLKKGKPKSSKRKNPKLTSSQIQRNQNEISVNNSQDTNSQMTLPVGDSDMDFSGFSMDMEAPEIGDMSAVPLIEEVCNLTCSIIPIIFFDIFRQENTGQEILQQNDEGQYQDRAR